MNIESTDQALPRKVKMLLLSGFALLLSMMAVYYFGGFSDKQATSTEVSSPPPAVVVVNQSRSMIMAPHAVLPGTVVSVRDATIASETSGKILSVAHVGDVVGLNDNIAEIDPQSALQLVAQRRAELQRLQSLHRYHSDYFKRVGVEENKLGIPEIGIAQLKSNVETAKADVARAVAAFTAAENDLKRTKIKAPFAGRVVSQSIQPGEYAQIGSPIARLVDTENLEVSARVPAALVQPIEAGTLLDVTGMGKTFSAPVRTLVPVGDAISRTMELRVVLNHSGLLVGSPVRVSLPSAPPREVVAVPRDALVLRAEAQYVFVVIDGTAQRRDVQLGYADGDMIEVVGEVDSGVTVVVRGGERLRDGQSVSWEEVGGRAVEEISRGPV